MKKLLSVLLVMTLLLTMIPLGVLSVSAENLIGNGYFQYSTYGWDVHSGDEAHNLEYPGKVECYICCEAAHRYRSSTADEQGVHIVGHGCSETLFSKVVDTIPGRRYDFYAEYKVADYEEQVRVINQEGASLKAGDTFQLGYYPKTRVTDEKLIKKLESVGGEWQVLINSTWVGSTFYLDVVHNAKKYRAIKISECRTSWQKVNGYNEGGVYWFEYAPINWVLLDETTGFSVCSEVIDAQAFHHTGEKLNGYYGNNYERSDIRDWLLEDFSNVAFSMDEDKMLLTKSIDNSAASSKYSSANTFDKVFLLSKNEFTKYTFSKSTTASDYAKAMGATMSGSACRYWNLRTAANKDYSYYYVTSGRLDFNGLDDALHGVSMGVRPGIYVDIANYKTSTYKTEIIQGSGMSFSIAPAGYYGNTSSARTYYTEFLESEDWDSIRTSFIATTTKTKISFIGSGCGADSETKESIFLDDVRMYEMKNSTVDSSSFNGDQDFIQEHIDFIKSWNYRSSTTNLRFAKTIAESRNSTKNNVAFFAYDIIEGAMELISFKEISSLKNPYDVLLLDILANRSVNESLAEVSENAAANALQKLVKNLKTLYNGDSDWSSELADVDAFKKLNKLDPDNWTSNKTYQALEKLLKDKSKADMNKVLSGLNTYSDTLSCLDTALTGVKYMMEAIRIGVAVEAYVSATDAFKKILSETASAMSGVNGSFGSKFREAYNNYSNCMSRSAIAKKVAEYVVERGAFTIVELSNKLVKESLYTYCTVSLGMSAAAATSLVASLWAAEVGFGLGNMITNMDDIANSNRMIRACYWLDQAVYKVMDNHANKLESSESYTEAIYFDEAFKLFVSVQNLSLNYYKADREARGESLLEFLLGRKNLYKSEAQAMAEIIRLWNGISCHSGDYSDLQTYLIACPTDVYVYDKKTGELVAAVIDNVVENTVEDKLTVVAVDNEKAVSAADLSIYDIRVVATDSGTMNVVYSENGLNGDYQNRVVEFNDVSLTAEDTFSVHEDLETDMHTLKRGENETIIPDVDTSDLVMVVVDTAISANGLVVTCCVDGVSLVAAGYTEPRVEISTSSGAFVTSEYVEQEGEFIFEVPAVVVQDEDLLYAVLVANQNGEEYAGNAQEYLVKDSVLFEADGGVLAHYPSGGDKTTYVIPSATEYIADGAFDGCGLNEITIPLQTYYYGVNAFAECEELTTVYFEGDEEDRAALLIERGNEALKNATWHYNVALTSRFSNSTNSISEEVNGLAFRFDMNASGGRVVRDTRYVSGSADVTPYRDAQSYKLLRMGAVVSNDAKTALMVEDVNGKTTINVEAKYLYALDEESLSFAVRIINIPEDKKGEMIYARPYYVYECDGEEVVVYGDVDAACYEDYVG